jgi:AraC-like DNA-binding protein
VTARTFFCKKEHHSLQIKNNLREPVEDRRAVARQASPPRAARGSGQQGEKPPSPLQKLLNLMFGMCKSQHVTDVKAQYERRARRKDTKSVKEIHANLNLQPPHSPIASEGAQSPTLNLLRKELLVLM